MVLAQWVEYLRVDAGGREFNPPTPDKLFTMGLIVTDRLKDALFKTQTSYDLLWKDIADGKLTLDQIKQKHEDIIDETASETEKLLEIPVPNIVIEIADGEIQDVYSDSDGITYTVYDPDLEYDEFDIKDAKHFTNYEALRDELDGSYISVNEVNQVLTD